ncbi:MAG: hypothetical protein KatS3mg086_160 [Candidatus Dojkabacteria bacterium]|nr:MAG: hypothetical protein KatS3mg086_160 [Candidatus Dojkabacteria bacterium]
MVSKEHANKIFLCIIFVLIFNFSFPTYVGAVNTGLEDPTSSLICRIFPFLYDIVYVNSAICFGNSSGGADAVNDLISLAQFGLTLVFVGIIAIAVYVVIKASIKYIRSEGEQEKVVEAQKAIKQVFAGLAALFIGLIGLVIILTIFNATGAAGGAVQTPDDVEILNNVGL